jgi:hypothetical protein
MAKKGSASVEKKGGDTKKAGDKKGKQGNAEAGEESQSKVCVYGTTVSTMTG